MSQPDRRRAERRLSPLSVGVQWASAITTIGMEMAVPPLAGFWLDNHFGTAPLWTVLLAILGFAVAMRHLWKLSKRLSGQNGQERDTSRRSDQSA